MTAKASMHNNDEKARPHSDSGSDKGLVTTDQIVNRNRQQVARARGRIFRFLETNGFDPENVNCRKKTKHGFIFDSYTFPLHLAAQQNDLDMVQLLLWFGADPLLYDSRSRCAYDLANKEVKMVFERMNAAPHSRRISGKTKMERIPPPRGFERFFEELEKDPLVTGVVQQVKGRK